MTDQFQFDNPIIPGSIWNENSDFMVPVISPVGAGPKGDKGDAAYFDDLTEEQLQKIYQEASFVGNKSFDEVVTTTGVSTTTIPIPWVDYDQFDMLFIDVNGLDLSEHDDYEIVSGNIVLTTPLPAGQDVHFRALKYQLVDGDKTIKNYMGRKDYNTVAEMQADDLLEPGDICHTLGFHTPGDGGAAWYKVKAHGAVNGMDILDLENDCIAVLQIIEDYVTPEMFGAWGDGEHDDTNAFKAVIATISEKPGSYLYIPISNGELYLITDTLNITTNYMTVLSDAPYNLAWNNCGIWFNPPTADSVLFNVAASGVRMENLILRGNEPVGNYTGIAIQCGMPSQADTDIHINGCFFVHFDTCVKHYDRGLEFYENSVAEVNTAIDIYSRNLSYTGNNTMRGIIIRDNRFHNLVYAVKVNASQPYGMLLTGNFLDSPPTLNERALTLFYADEDSNIFSGIIANNSVIDSHDYCIDIECVINGLEINGNVFMNRRGVNIEGFIKAYNMQNSIVVNNNLNACSKHAIYFNSISNSIVSNNRFSNCAYGSTTETHYADIYIATSMLMTIFIGNLLVLPNGANCRGILYDGNNVINNVRINNNMGNRAELFTNANGVEITNSNIQASNIG